MTSDLIRVTRALISVSDKTGLVALGQALAERGVDILSTGGSAQRLRESGVPVTEVADFTGHPEMLDGRVKTLHPRLHGGILGRRDLASHREQMTAHDIPPIDLVVVNLYPFEATVARGAGFKDCVENIDIGGPTLIRAAAKNHDSVAVITDPADYQSLLDELTANDGATSLRLRRQLARLAYSRTALYDSAISRWFAEQAGETFPPALTFGGRLAQSLRYGENPHQQAALYLGGPARPGVGSAVQVQGKELSYNNLNDTDAAYELVAEFDRPAVAIIKHANPCGVAEAATQVDAYRAALLCDPVSAFGGIIALNRPLEAATAAEIAKLFVEVIIAPDAGAEARAIIATKKNLRLLLTRELPDPDLQGLTVRTIAGGFLVQTRDTARIGLKDLKVVTRRQPTEQELADLLIAFRVAKHTKSNAIIYVRNGATVGVGAGQMSRVDSARIAALKAADATRMAGLTELMTRGSAVASEAFFPFADGLIAAAEAGATAVIQPGGSMRDAEVIAAADERGLAMVFTGVRHFRH
ncbi:MAG: bifunctional phosphoribosylaminoimidazolecarboxamide formyltransferase/IMP cyclohydrolase [Rhodospirillaceae bacterium]